MDWIGSRALLNVHKFTHTYVGGVFCLFFVTRILRVGVQIFILSRCGLFTIKSHIFAILKTVCNRNKYAWSYSLSSFWVLSLGVQWVQIVQIFSLSVWVVHHQIIFLPFFFFPGTKIPHFFSQHHSLRQVFKNCTFELLTFNSNGTWNRLNTDDG